MNWTLIAQVVSALAGAAGTILTPIYGTNLASAIVGVLQALSALLLVIPTVTTAVVHVTREKARLGRAK